MKTQAIARGLGWFSIGLGAYEAAAPGHLASWLGMKHGSSLLGAYGFRELTAGIGILEDTKPAPGWLWARVGGDIIDLATLAGLLKSSHSNRSNVAIAIGAVAGVMALDVLCSLKLPAE